MRDINRAPSHDPKVSIWDSGAGADRCSNCHFKDYRNMKNIANKLSYLIIAGTFIFMAIYAYFSFYPFNILEFDQVNAEGAGYYEVVTPTVKQGGLLQYHSIFTKNMDLRGKVSCYFEDGILFRVPEFTSDNSTGVNDTIRAVKVPETLPEGTYRYSCKIFYKLTMHRVVEYTFVTGFFEVTQ